jgi:predicted dehydrogenase
MRSLSYTARMNDAPAAPATKAPLRLGVLGASRIAPFAIYRPARHIEGVEVAAIAARDRARAEKVASKFGVGRIHDGYDALLADPGIDAIYVPLPNSLHSRWAIAALEAGKHVLCEKPLASNADEARAMAEAAARSGRVLMEAFHWRFHPMAQRMVEIASSELGRLRRIETWMCIPFIVPGDIRFRLDLAGGAMMDTGAYAMHMLRTLAGREPTVVSAEAKLASPGVDRSMRAEVDFGDGLTGMAVASLFSATLLRIKARVVGERGHMVADNPVAPQFLHRLVVSVDGKRRVERFEKTASYTHQLRAFSAAVRGGRAALCGPDDSIANMTAIDAVYRAAGLHPRGKAA